jgi:hypothetical protein
MDKATAEALAHRRDIRREIELLYHALAARQGTLAKILEDAQLDPVVLDVIETEAHLLRRLDELLGAFVDTFPDLPEDQRQKLS